MSGIDAEGVQKNNVADILSRAMVQRRSMGLARIDPDRPVERGLVERLLEAANWAPSHGETEPWRFTVYMGESRGLLGEAFAETYWMSREAEEYRQAAYEAQRDRAWMAPVWISIGMTPALNPDGTLRMREEEELMAVACAVQNLHLLASAMGLAGMWQSNTLSLHPHMARFVGLTPPSRLLGFFSLGWPAVPWPEGERRPLAEKVQWAAAE